MISGVSFHLEKNFRTLKSMKYICRSFNILGSLTDDGLFDRSKIPKKSYLLAPEDLIFEENLLHNFKGKNHQSRNSDNISFYQLQYRDSGTGEFYDLFDGLTLVRGFLIMSSDKTLVF